MNKDFTPEKKLCNCHEDLLLLIENGDVVNILYEENMESFNYLMKYELITVKEDKVYLTSLGKEAQLKGVKTVLSQKNIETVSTGVPSADFKERRNFISVFILLVALTLLFIAIQNILE